MMIGQDRIGLVQGRGRGEREKVRDRALFCCCCCWCCCGLDFRVIDCDDGDDYYQVME